MPALEAVHQAAGDDVAFVGVAVNDRVDDALELADRTGVTYPLAADPPASCSPARRGHAAAHDASCSTPTARWSAASSGEITADELVEVLAEETGVEVALP